MRNVAASIKDRLQNLAREKNLRFNDVLEDFAMARLFARLAASDQAGKFILKGAQLFTLWAGVPHRPTRDADFLSFGPPDPATLEQVFNQLGRMSTEPADGLKWEPAKAAAIREDNLYGGVRIRLSALLGRVRIPVQVDVGFGDSITPEAVPADWLSPLDFPPVRLLAYCPETVIAEKLQAAVVLDTGNSRMKDFFDLLWLSRHREFSGKRLQQAVQATFARRDTALPGDGVPLAFTGAFHSRPDKRTQWEAFLRKGDLPSMELSAAIDEIARFLVPVMRGEVASSLWSPQSGWARREP